MRAMGIDRVGGLACMSIYYSAVNWVGNWNFPIRKQYIVGLPFNLCNFDLEISRFSTP